MVTGGNPVKASDVTPCVLRRCVLAAIGLCLAAVVASCGSSGHGDAKAASGAALPATYVALDYPTQGPNVQLQLFSTAAGALVRNLNLSGLPSGVYLSDLSPVAVAGNIAYWGAVQNGPTFEGHIVATPLDGGDSKVLTTGVDPIPSPDGKRLLIVETSQQSGQIPSGFALDDLSTGRSTDLPALSPSRAFVTFAWLPDDHTVVALYPGYSGCRGPAACLPVPIAPAPAAWSLDTSAIPQVWRPMQKVESAVAGMRLVGPGPASGTIVAELSGRTEKVTVLNVDSALAPSGREVTLEGSCNAVDHNGLNLICNSGKGIVTISLNDAHPRVIGPMALINYELAWS